MNKQIKDRVEFLKFRYRELLIQVFLLKSLKSYPRRIKRMNKRDWQADMALCEKATQEPWVSERAKLLPWSTVYPQDSFKFICERVKHEDADFIAEARTALPYWLHQYAEEKARAEIAELAYQGLAENAVNRGEYQSLLDKHTAMTKAYRAEKERTDQAEAREQKLKEAIEWAIKETGWGDPENILDEIANKLQDTISTLYPVMEKEAKTK